MQDVIFQRLVAAKAVARASVELFFDNSLGRAAGQWSQYAEISVKRVCSETANRPYFINNSRAPAARADIFLGTGLGPRA